MVFKIYHFCSEIIFRQLLLAFGDFFSGHTAYHVKWHNGTRSKEQKSYLHLKQYKAVVKVFIFVMYFWSIGKLSQAMNQPTEPDNDKIENWWNKFFDLLIEINLGWVISSISS